MTSIVDKVFGNGVGDSIFVLGGIELGFMEVPDTFNFGGEQLQTVHQLVGGARIIDVLGQSDHDITFNGFFWGELAAERARYLDDMRCAGQEIEFIFGEFVYLVVIVSYSAQFERYYQVPYTITLRVVKNYTLPVPFAAPDSYNDAVDTDYNTAVSNTALVGDAVLTAAIDALGVAINNGGNLASATPAQLNNITTNITSSQMRVAALIAQNNTGIFS
jgi:hypothetical protein